MKRHGISVAEGIKFSDGIVVLRWLGDTPSTIICQNEETFRKIHFHVQTTNIVWLDEQDTS